MALMITCDVIKEWPPAFLYTTKTNSKTKSICKTMCIINWGEISSICGHGLHRVILSLLSQRFGLNT